MSVTSSAFFDGTGYLSAPSSSDLYFAGDFTIDLWVRPTVSVAGTILGRTGSGSFGGPVGDAQGPYEVYYDGAGHARFYASSGGNWDIASNVDMGPVPLNAWTHIAVVRSGNTYFTFNSGNQISTFTSSAVPYSAPLPLGIGNRPAFTINPDFFNGFLDEVRVSNIARWTAPYAPLTAPYLGDANTVILLHFQGQNGSTVFINAGGPDLITPHGGVGISTAQFVFAPPAGATGPPYPHPQPVPNSNAIGSFAIGVSPVGDIPAFDYWKTVISQYGNSTILTQLISNFFQYIDPTSNLDSFFDNMWNVDSAQGYGLDVWGRIVGVIRTINLPPGGKFFGFEEQSITVDPFNQSPFFSGQGLTNSFQLPDSSFRTLIFAKALANISNGSIPALNQLLLNLFPGRGNCFVTDGLNMSMTYTFTFALTPTEVAIITQSGVLPKSTGVSATVVQQIL